MLGSITDIAVLDGDEFEGSEAQCAIPLKKADKAHLGGGRALNSLHWIGFVF